MQIHQVSKSGLKESYGILCNSIFDNVNLSLPMGSTWCEINSGGATTPHGHFEGEIFFVFEGVGQMRIAGEVADLRAGEAVYIPPFSDHTLANLGAAPLKFISVYWPGPQAAGAELPKTVFITSAPPTPNGDLHLGHLSGPYIAADIYARYLKMRNVKVVQVSGSDDNQSYVAVKAFKMGVTAPQVVERYATNNERTLKNAAIELDHFLNPSRDAEYVKFTREFLKTMFAKGVIVEKNAPSLHCPSCEKYIYEAHVRGLCPNCHGATSGNGCEACGFVNDCVDLIDPLCARCETRPEVRSAKRLYFQLNDYADKLRAYHNRLNLSSHLRRFVEGALSRTLPDVSITHFAEWGINTSIPGLESQVIYEWFEMAAGYVYLAQKLNAGGPSASLLSDEQTQMVQFFGFDNSFFYTLFIPAVLMAYDSALNLPKAFVTNEFYRLKGEKFSTSRNHAIWGDELLGKLDADVIRFYLSYDRPETAQSNLDLNEFASLVEKQLVHKLGGWLDDLDQRLGRTAGRCASALELNTPARQKFYGRLVETTRAVAESYSVDSFSPAQVTRHFVALLDESLRFFAGESFALAGQPQASASACSESTLSFELLSLKVLCLMIYPVMPEFAGRTLKALGVDSPVWSEVAEPVRAGYRIEKLSSDSFLQSLNGLKSFILNDGAKYV